jgi:hypothetical protein
MGAQQDGALTYLLERKAAALVGHNKDVATDRKIARCDDNCNATVDIFVVCHQI